MKQTKKKKWMDPMSSVELNLQLPDKVLTKTQYSRFHKGRI